MPCYTPLNAWATTKPQKNGKRSIVFSPKHGPHWEAIALPCGCCVGCRLAQSRQWAVRCSHEASLHINNCFLTLTYNKEHVPIVVDSNTGEYICGTLVKRHMQLFMKRLRRRFPCLTIRFFLCGEYGEKLSRPHYHILIFGLDFFDKYVWSVNKKTKLPLYRSDILESLWVDNNKKSMGFSSVGALTFESAAYVARYALKKVNGDGKFDHYKGMTQEFTTMSRRPGIAKDWIDLYKDDVYPHDYVQLLNGVRCKPPRYYDQQFDLTNSDEMLDIRQERQDNAEGNPDNMYDRLAVREKVQHFKLPLLKRSIEQ